MKTLKISLTEKQHVALIDAIRTHLNSIFDEAGEEANNDRKLLIKVREKLFRLDFYESENI